MHNTVFGYIQMHIRQAYAMSFFFSKQKRELAEEDERRVDDAMTFM